MSAFRRASHLLPPRLRSIFTSPLVKSPYSTEGIPRTTSTLSMSSVDIDRISTPEFTKLRPSVDVSHAPFTVWQLALVLMGAPSIINDTPNDDVLYELAVPVSRMRMVLGELSTGSCERPPGRSSSKSVKLDGCRCSMACFLMIEAEVNPLDSWAVTTTSPMAETFWRSL